MDWKKAEREHEKAMVGRTDWVSILMLGTDELYAAYEGFRQQGVSFLGKP